MRHSHTPGRVFPGIFLLTIFIFALLAPTPAGAVVEEGRSLGAFPQLKGIHGDTFDFNEIQQAYTLFVFFSIYSETSAELLLDYAGMLHLSPDFPKQIHVVAVNVDPSENAVREYMNKLLLPFPVLLDSSLELSKMFGVKEMPTLVLVDPDKTVRLAQSGFTLDQVNDFSKRIEPILGLMPGVPQATPEEAAETDIRYKEKKMLSNGAVTAEFCPVCDSLMMYISNDNILWTYDFRIEKLDEVATDVASAGWGPSGRSVVFAGKKIPGVWIKELDGEAKKISPFGDRPAWSPAGDHIAFVVDDAQIWVSRLSIGKRWKVAVAGNRVAWSPDGTLLMITDKKDRVWLISPYARASYFKMIFD